MGSVAVSVGIVLALCAAGTLAARSIARRTSPGEPMPRRAWIAAGALALYCSLVASVIASGHRAIGIAVALGAVVGYDLVVLPWAIRRSRRRARDARARR